MQKSRLHIYGAGGLGKVAYDILHRSYKDIVYVDNDESKKIWYNQKVIHQLVFRNNSNFLIALGNNGLRKQLFHTYKNMNFVSCLAQSSVVSHSCSIGKGGIIFNNCSIGPDVTVGMGCILNFNCVIDHDTKIGDFVHVRHNAIVEAGAFIPDNCYVGANSVIGNKAKLIPGTIVPPNSIL